MKDWLSEIKSGLTFSVEKLKPAHKTYSNPDDDWHVHSPRTVLSLHVLSPHFSLTKDPITSSALIRMMKYQNMFTAIYTLCCEICNDTSQPSFTHMHTRTLSQQQLTHGVPIARARQNPRVRSKGATEKNIFTFTNMSGYTHKHTHTHSPAT